MRVAIAGAGNVGQFIAADLLSAGHEVLMLEKDPAVVETARLGLSDAEWFVVDACEVLSLEFAGLRFSDVVVAATGDDEDNLVISLLAKQEFAVPRVVARVNNPKNHGLFTEAWGVDVAVSTPHILRSLVEEAVSVGSMVHLLSFEQGHVSMLEATLAKESPSVGRTISDLALPMDSAVVGVIREGHVVRPRDDTVLAAGDEVLVIASDSAADQVRRALVVEPEGNGGPRTRVAEPPRAAEAIRRSAPAPAHATGPDQADPRPEPGLPGQVAAPAEPEAADAADHRSGGG